MESKNIESKIAFLERHVEEQDKVILELSKNQDALIREVKELRELLRSLHHQLSLSEKTIEDEKPPHY